MAYESMSFAVGFSAEYGGIQNSLFQVQKKLDKTMEHLSTGKRINDMKDDEGGKAISDVMSSWKTGTDESVQNLKEFITMTKVAEKALNDIQDILFHRQCLLRTCRLILKRKNTESISKLMKQPMGTEQKSTVTPTEAECRFSELMECSLSYIF